MDDTSSDITKKVCEMFQEKSPTERLKMGCSMYETSKYLVARAIWENNNIYSVADLKQQLFLRFYGNDFDAETRQKILEYIGSSSASANEVQPATLIQEESPFNFEHIHSSEKGQEWWTLLYSLVQARLLRENPENSNLLRVLSKVHGVRTWRDIKHSIEIALANVKNGASILARTAEIKNSPDPDGIIDDMFGELRTVPYLLMKGFTDITYFRRDGLDFTAKIEGKLFHIESTYVHGPDFKTQEYMFTPTSEMRSSIYKIRPDKLIRLLERIYANKKAQVTRYGGTAHDSLIVVVTDLEETHAPWLEHAKIQGVHPILKLILDWEIPTVILGCGSVYEPHATSLGGVFGKLYPFDWLSFANRYLTPNPDPRSVVEYSA